MVAKGSDESRVLCIQLVLDKQSQEYINKSTKETLDWQNLTHLAHNYYTIARYIYNLVIIYLHACMYASRKVS